MCYHSKSLCMVYLRTNKNQHHYENIELLQYNVSLITSEGRLDLWQCSRESVVMAKMIGMALVRVFTIRNMIIAMEEGIVLVVRRRNI